MTRYWQTDALDLKPTPRHEKKKKTTTTQVQNRAVPHIKTKISGINTRGRTHIQTHTPAQPYFMLKQEFDKYQRDGVRISMWIPYALRLSEEKGRHLEGRRKVQRGWYFKKDRGKIERTMEPSESGKWGLALQKEYAWQGECCSENNKVVKSLSPQAPCMAHLDLLAGVLAPVFVIFPSHFIPFAMALQPSLSSSSLSEDHSLFLYISCMDPLFLSLLASVFFASWPPAGAPSLLLFFHFCFLALFISSPHLSILFQRLFWTGTTRTYPNG